MGGGEVIDVVGEEMMAKVETSSPVVEWGVWPLWVLASVTVGGFIIENRFQLFFTLAVNLGGFIGFVFAGFLPWFAQKWRISKIEAWAFTLVCLASTIVVLVIIFLQDHVRLFFFMQMLIWVPVFIASLIMASVIRGVCQRWLSSEALWWEWGLAGILVLVEPYLMLMFTLSLSGF